jgi:ankyrin repeat protein
MQLCYEAHGAIDKTEEAIFDADRRWDPVREWMRTHTADEVHAAVRQRDEFGKTALHLACQNAPPDDVIDVFLTIAKDVVQWRDSYGLLSIHYACAHSSSIHVVKSLTTSFPESKTVVDRQGRTPLHCAWGPSSVQSADVIQILASSGAAAYPDSNGMLVSMVENS